MRGHVRGVLADLVIRTDDGVMHHGVYIIVDRDTGIGEFYALCGFDEVFPDYLIGTVRVNALRTAGVPYKEHGYIGTSNCIGCIASFGDWGSADEKDVFGK